MMPSRTSPGFYGKVPNIGDFISRRLTSQFVRPWDEWLQVALARSREQLRSEWLDIYLTSPIWRFILSPGTCGAEACAGVLMPSVDRVGRYFPLTLAAFIPRKELLPRLFFIGAEWFAKLESLALSVLDDGFDLEQFDRDLQSQVLEEFLPPNGGSGGAEEQRQVDSEAATQKLSQSRVEAAGKASELYENLNACLASRFKPEYSLWCTSGSEMVKPSLIVFDGLPPPASFTEFLAGPKGTWKNAAFSLISQSDNRDNSGMSWLSDIPSQASGNPAAAAWSSSGLTNVGHVRKINQDAFIERSEAGLWAVADGMGGHKAGEDASKAVVDALQTVSPAGNNLERFSSSVVVRLKQVNSELIEMARGFGAGEIVGSTVVVLLAAGNRCAAVWVGDSRIYRYRDRTLVQLTEDHSLVAELSRMGVNNREELSEGPVSSVLTRALGAEERIEVDTIISEAKEGDVFLLCSDGLTREVSSGEIAEILGKRDCERSSRELIDLALSRGARDNVTVVVVRYGAE